MVDIEGRADGYRLVAGDHAVDSRHFDSLVAQGREAVERNNRKPRRRPWLRGSICGGGPLSASWPRGPSPSPKRPGSTRPASTPTEDLAEAELALGRTASALGRLEPLVHQFPLRERAVGQLMVALYRTCRQAEALAVYQSLRRTLADELGLVPTPALRDLEAAILRQSEELLAPSPTPTPDEPDRHSVVLGDTVAFLFTDIEASTRAWEGDAAGMGSDLERHDAILTDISLAWDGQVFAHTGDGLCVAFPTAAAAIGAAVDGQRALEAAGWQQAVPLRVRMAVHAGAAQRRGDNWFGPTLNRAARLLTAASGGQVICSETAAGLSRDLLPDEMGLVDCGEVNLPDLSRPERVYQVTHPDLRAPTAPLRSVAREPECDNLPAALTRFVGRARELAEIQEELMAKRLVTLVGPGGAGKTRLALAVAGVMRKGFPDGVRLVELAPVRDGALVPQTIAAGIGLLVGELAQSEQGIEAALAERLLSRRMLIVLDNCEQVIDAAASAAHRLLASCPDVAVLATSREALAVPGEVVFTVPPLEAPDAVALFCARAHDADRHFSLSEANADAVQRICRRLDGLPLALEIAAARARVLGTKELAERLDDRFAALGEGSRTAPARHQTLRAAIDWSHELLSSAEQAVLHRLSVFPGTFDLERDQSCHRRRGRCAVYPPRRQVAGRRDRRSERALATSSPSRSARTPPNSWLPAAITPKAQRAHRDAFLATATFWSSHGQDWQLTADVFRSLDSDYANFMAALDWSWTNGDHDAAVSLSSALLPYWYWSGHPEARDWMERAAAVPVSSPAMIRPAVITRIGLACLLRNFGGDASGRLHSLIADAVEVADAGNDALSQALTRCLAADFFMVTGRTEIAREYLHRGQATFQILGAAGRRDVLRTDGCMDRTVRRRHRRSCAGHRTPHGALGVVGRDSLHLPHTLACAALIRARIGDPSAPGSAPRGSPRRDDSPLPRCSSWRWPGRPRPPSFWSRPPTPALSSSSWSTTLRQLGARRWVGRGVRARRNRLRRRAARHGRAGPRRRRTPADGTGRAVGARLPARRDARQSERAAFASRLGAEGFRSQKARGANLPVDEALAFVAGRLGGGG